MIPLNLKKTDKSYIYEPLNTCLISLRPTKASMGKPFFQDRSQSACGPYPKTVSIRKTYLAWYPQHSNAKKATPIGFLQKNDKYQLPIISTVLLKTAPSPRISFSDSSPVCFSTGAIASSTTVTLHPRSSNPSTAALTQ